MSERVISTIGKYGEDPVWDRYFMGIALLCAKRSKDESTQVGACVVNDEPRVIGTGYNGMPLNIHDSLIWGPKGDCPQDSDNRKQRHGYVCHAELNAIVNRNPKSVKGCTVYVTLFPCNECAKIIINSGIKRVVYLYLPDEKAKRDEFKASKKMLEANEVGYFKFDETIDIGGIENETAKICFDGEHSGEHSGENSGEHSNEHSDIRKKELPISWKHFFMSLAVWSGQARGEEDDPAKEGACIVNEDKRIVGLGYVQNIKAAGVEYKDLCVMHAPVKAIVNQSPASLADCTLYTVRHPCNECAKVIVQSGITKVIYMKKKDERCQDEMLKKRLNAQKLEEKRRAAKRMFAIAQVRPERYAEKDDRMESLTLDFKR